MFIRHRRYTIAVLFVVAGFLGGLVLSDSIWAASIWAAEKTTQTAETSTTQKDQKDLKEKSSKTPPKPKDEIFDTADGVRLYATFYPGMKEKDSVPVILIHDFKSNRKAFHDLALYLQARGCAVLVPDLRGHGQSIYAEGYPYAINPDRMGTQQFQMIPSAQGDVEACKKFLMNKNNKGELNIEKLCVIGAGLGAIVAANWATLDWNWPPLATGKQGQDVKALVLISPVWSANGLFLKSATSDEAFRKIFAMMLIVGRDDKKSMKCADSVAKIIERFNPGADAEEAENRTFFYLQPDTSLQGMQMLEEKSLKLPEQIAKFIEMRLINQKILWKERKKAF